MAECSTYSSVADALADFSGQAPLDAITCAFSSSEYGLGLGTLFPLLMFGFVGLALTVRTRSVAPVAISGILSAGIVGGSVPGIGAEILALVLLLAIAVAGLVIYQRAQSSL
jgi:hypothetical protein